MKLLAAALTPTYEFLDYEKALDLTDAFRMDFDGFSSIAVVLPKMHIRNSIKSIELRYKAGDRYVISRNPDSINLDLVEADKNGNPILPLVPIKNIEVTKTAGYFIDGVMVSKLEQLFYDTHENTSLSFFGDAAIAIPFGRAINEDTLIEFSYGFPTYNNQPLDPSIVLMGFSNTNVIRKASDLDDAQFIYLQRRNGCKVVIDGVEAAIDTHISEKIVSFYDVEKKVSIHPGRYIKPGSYKYFFFGVVQDYCDLMPPYTVIRPIGELHNVTVAQELGIVDLSVNEVAAGTILSSDRHQITINCHKTLIFFPIQAHVPDENMSLKFRIRVKSVSDHFKLGPTDNLLELNQLAKNKAAYATAIANLQLLKSDIQDRQNKRKPDGTRKTDDELQTDLGKVPDLVQQVEDVQKQIDTLKGVIHSTRRLNHFIDSMGFGFASKSQRSGDLQYIKNSSIPMFGRYEGANRPDISPLGTLSKFDEWVSAEIKPWAQVEGLERSEAVQYWFIYVDTTTDSDDVLIEFRDVFVQQTSVDLSEFTYLDWEKGV